MQRIIEINDGVAADSRYAFNGPVNLTLEPGEQIAVIGDNAAGKTRLVEVITGKHRFAGNALHYDFSPSGRKLVSENIKYIAFRDSYGESDAAYYLQQRWNSQEIDEEAPTMRKMLDKAFDAAGRFSVSGQDEAARAELERKRRELRDKLYDIFRLEPLLDKYLITLSSGELRKFQIARALFSMPSVLVMDNPFIGLDAGTRASLADLIAGLARETGLLTITVLPAGTPVPGYVTHVIPVMGLSVGRKMPISEYAPSGCAGWSREEIAEAVASIPERPAGNFYPAAGTEIVRCRNITVRYWTRTILDHLDWTVNEGERWALCGENGCGKSTLLSLVCADNPQAYACDIELFGHKRGSGESIWDIKKHIGYVSPEMFRAYNRDIPAINVVASGLFDTIGMFFSPGSGQLDTCRTWMGIFGIGHLADRSFTALSSGEQRLCLLARAFVKDPELLILDEPMHGLDMDNCMRVKEIIGAFMLRKRKTLIMVSHYEEDFPSCIDHRIKLEKVINN